MKMYSASADGPAETSGEGNMPGMHGMPEPGPKVEEVD